MEIRTAPPRIPDHEVLRCIGKGSYGEVWLARAVTGTLRAVKVVHRGDFELDRTFEREFEGIMKFEPISRENPGLVQILHVGRNDEQQFYYYVMELGDDRERGSRVDASDYEPRTLGTDKAMKHRLPIAEVIEHGTQVAEGLAHMHECGLTHRDIKPANIIFLNGKAKLADIGLVAAAGQMTFVGTEGFVPPEGPGSKLADIYSLGMVLYEVSTGKDRLQFPELPDDLGDERTRPQRQALNEIILKACASQPKRRFQNAREMAAALRAAGRRRHRNGHFLRRLITLPIATAAAAFLLVTWRHNGAMPWPPGRFASINGVTPQPVIPEGRVEITSHPAGAEVLYQGKFLDRTPCTVPVPPGDAVFTLRRKNHLDATLTVTGIQAGTVSRPAAVPLQYHNPPKPGQEWTNSLDMVFDARPDGHISRRAVSYHLLQPQYSVGNVAKEQTGPNEELYLFAVPWADALRFCDELTQKETRDGWLTPDLCYRPEAYTPPDPEEAKKIKEGNTCFRLVVEKYGSVTIVSNPPGAEIRENGVLVGNTANPWQSGRHRPGKLEFILALPGYSETILTGELKSGATLSLGAEMIKNKTPVFGERWENSLGIPFIPLSADVLAAAWEARVQDYSAFAKATGAPVRHAENARTGRDDLNRLPTHPAVNVTRDEARAFCAWLTRTERENLWIDTTMEYRLPSDTEWSLAAGSPNLNESRITPAERHLSVTGVYPWVPPYQFPPPGGSSTSRAAGNLGDLTALRRNLLGPLKPEEVKALETLGYNDNAAFTSPAGTFAPNGIGLYDLSGNVWEFVEDDYGDTQNTERQHDAVLRGGAWNTPATQRDELATQYRLSVPPDKSDTAYGFRIVLASLLPPPAPAVPPASGPQPVPPGSFIPQGPLLPPSSATPGQPSPLSPPPQQQPGSGAGSNSNSTPAPGGTNSSPPFQPPPPMPYPFEY